MRRGGRVGRKRAECLIFAGSWEKCFLGGGFQQRPQASPFLAGEPAGGRERAGGEDVKRREGEGLCWRGESSRVQTCLMGSPQWSDPSLENWSRHLHSGLHGDKTSLVDSGGEERDEDMRDVCLLNSPWIHKPSCVCGKVSYTKAFSSSDSSRCTLGKNASLQICFIVSYKPGSGKDIYC